MVIRWHAMQSTTHSDKTADGGCDLYGHSS